MTSWSPPIRFNPVRIRSSMLVAVALAMLAAPVAAQDLVRVGVLGKLEPARVEVSSPASFAVEGGPVQTARRVLVERADDLVACTDDTGARWTARSIVVRPTSRPLTIEVAGRERRSRMYDARVEVTSWGGKLLVVAAIPVETVVASGVRAELAGVAEAAALEATAIALRSFVVAAGSRHPGEPIDLCDTTHCFFSQGDTAALDLASRAAATTARRVLVHGGRPVTGYVTAVCGGGTTTPAALWGRATPDALVPVRCSWCRASPLFRWRRRVAQREVAAVLDGLIGAEAGRRPRLRARAGPNGWATSLRVGNGSAVNADAFRIALGRRLGWDALPSTRFAVVTTPGGYVFSGGGHGHGIGLCLAGAVAMARAGRTSEAILAHYFPGAIVR